jgi:heme A synthase
MIPTRWRFIGAALFGLAIFISGFWLSGVGKPYDSLVINVHKLIALAAVVIFVVILVRAGRAARLRANEITAAVVAGLFFLGLFVTGGLTSALTPAPAIIRQLHHILPYAAVLAVMGLICFVPFGLFVRGVVRKK